MNFNIYLDNALVQALQRLAKRRKITRNALIRKAVEDLVHKETHSKTWSQQVLDWKGVPEFKPFEAGRAELADPASDPLK